MHVELFIECHSTCPYRYHPDLQTDSFFQIVQNCFDCPNPGKLIAGTVSTALLPETVDFTRALALQFPDVNSANEHYAHLQHTYYRRLIQAAKEKP